MGILIVTTNDCPGYRVTKTIGMCFGTAVRARNAVGNFTGRIAAIFGGSQTGAINMVSQTRTDALDELANHARQMGGNAVLAMRFDAGEFDAGQGQVMEMVTAYGTAVVIEKI
jgi:uncharacterized protein YbjQ (UPF0145 family)